MPPEVAKCAAKGAVMMMEEEINKAQISRANVNREPLKFKVCNRGL